MEAEKVSFSTTSKTIAYSQTPGTYADVKNPAFYLVVSPKGKAHWRLRAKDLRGKEVGKVADFEAYLDSDGRSCTNYEKALALAAVMRREARMTPEELAAARGQTLAQGFEVYKTNRVTKAGGALQQTTRDDYLTQYDRYLAPIGHWLLREKKAGDWTDFFYENSPKNPKKLAEKAGDAPPVDAVGGRKRAQKGGAEAPRVPIRCAVTLRLIALVSGIYDTLHNRDELNYNPIKKVRATRLFLAPEPRVKYVTTDDLQVFVENIQKRRVRHTRDIATLFLLTGLRHTALLRLRWSRVNFEHGYYEVHPDEPGWKGFEGLLPLSDAVLDVLRARREREKPRTDWVFPARNNPEGPMVDAGDAVSQGCDGLPYTVSPHDLRRTFSTAAYTVLSDVKAVGALLAHQWAVDDQGQILRDQQITLGYIQSELPYLRRASNRVSDFILEAAGQRPMTPATREILQNRGLEAVAERYAGALAAVNEPA